jgi:flagella basal body P-ring formation protein FlgA
MNLGHRAVAARKFLDMDGDMAFQWFQQIRDMGSPKQWIAIFVFVWVGAIVLPGAVVAGQTIEVKLLTAAKVDGESIQLGQIAEIQSDDPGLIDALGAIEMGRAPLPGQSLYVHPGRVEYALKHNSDVADNFQIIASGPVKVTRNFDTVTPDRIRTAVMRYIESHAPWDKKQMKIRPIAYDQSHLVPAGKVSLQITPAKHTDWLGAEPFSVAILVNGESVRRTAVPTYIEVWQDVFMTAKPMGKNQPLTRDDIKSEKMDIARLPADAVVRADQAIGKRVNRSIAINTILREDQLERQPLVHKGDQVQVLAESSLLKVSTRAVAQENGCIGERIQLINLRSKKSIYAQVIDAQTVKVEFR